MGARAFVLRACVVLCSAGSLLACPTGASAAFLHQYVSSFGSFANVQGVAVESSSGDVYVYDGGEAKVYKFDASGSPVEFSFTKTNSIEVPSAFGVEGEIAVDGSSGPARGDIYLAHADGSIVIYSAAGEEIGTLTEGGHPWGEACGVAVDTSGNVYVGLYSEHINKYVPSANPVTNADYAATIGGVSGVCNVAADSAGNAYSDTWSSGPVTRYEASQFGSLSATGSVVDSKGSTVAVDPANDEVYVDEKNQIVQFGPHGEPFEEPVVTFANTGSGSISESVGIAVSPFNHDVYVSDGKGQVSIFGPAIVLPDVTTGPASNVQPTSASVSGTVNPSGVQITECTVEYGPTNAYGESQSCAQTPGEIGSGSSPVEVSANLTGLTAGVVYHYRLAAANANGANQGADQTFATPGPPVVSEESFSSVAGSEAIVSADINPDFGSSTYHLEYGTSEAYGQSTPESEPVGSDNADHAVSVHIAGLTPGTTYHFRFVATNSVGTTNGADTAFTTYTVPVPSHGECSNEARRQEQNATLLPDCRAYEMVSPLDKNGGDIFGDHTPVAASVRGDRAEYASQAGFGETTGSGLLGLIQYVATRHEGSGWSSHGITPLGERAALQLLLGATESPEFSDDLGKAETFGVDLPAGRPAIAGGEDIYVEDTETGALQAATVPLAGPVAPLETIGLDLQAKADSRDMGVLTYETALNLLPETTGGAPKLYAFEHGVLKDAGVLPDGSLPVEGSGAPYVGFGDTARNQQRGAVSADGSHIAFISPTSESERQLYLRKDGTSTAWVSEPEWAGGPAKPKGVEFAEMTPDGKRVLFVTEDRLVEADPGTAAGGIAVYLYTDGSDPASESNLTFVARVNGVDQREFEVFDKGPIMSVDGERIYFYTAKTPGMEQGLHLWDKGAIHLVAPAERGIRRELARMSTDGRTLAFIHDERLTSNGPTGDKEAMYVYREQDETLVCASCPPTGAPETTSATILAKATFNRIAYPNVNFQPRFISSDGSRVFFNTVEPLVARDTNGREDAYEYDTETGEVSLLSPGTGDKGSWFTNADEKGDNVFVLTRQSLVSGDTDKLVDLYDVRVNGGFPQPKLGTGGCVGDECQGTPSEAPSFNTASGFSGLGNVVQHASKATSKSRPLTRAQKLKRALKRCRLKPPRKRRRCEAQARKRYGVTGTSGRTRR